MKSSNTYIYVPLQFAEKLSVLSIQWSDNVSREECLALAESLCCRDDGESNDGDAQRQQHHGSCSPWATTQAKRGRSATTIITVDSFREAAEYGVQHRKWVSSPPSPSSTSTSKIQTSLPSPFEAEPSSVRAADAPATTGTPVVASGGGKQGSEKQRQLPSSINDIETDGAGEGVGGSTVLLPSAAACAVLKMAASEARYERNSGSASIHERHSFCSRPRFLTGVLIGLKHLFRVP